MTEQHNTTPRPGPGWRRRVGAIARTAVAVATGTAVGYSTHNPGLGVTTVAATLSLLREAFPPGPPPPAP